MTAIAIRKNNHRGSELILVTIGHAAHAISTPMMVSLL